MPRPDSVTVQRCIPAKPHEIFSLLTDVNSHAEVDGSGTVKGGRGDPGERLTNGSTFSMNMHQGFSYSTVNTVVDFEPDRVIEWQTKPQAGWLSALVGGRTWRYELEPVAHGTKVRETWDLSQERARLPIKWSPLYARTRRDMHNTLRQIEETLTA